MQTAPQVQIELAPADVCRSWIGKGAAVIDVRGEAEYDAEHLLGATNIPLDKLTDWASQQTDKQQPLVLYCGKGIRAQMGINQLKQLGFSQLANGGSLSQIKATLGQ